MRCLNGTVWIQITCVSVFLGGELMGPMKHTAMRLFLAQKTAVAAQMKIIILSYLHMKTEWGLAIISKLKISELIGTLKCLRSTSAHGAANNYQNSRFLLRCVSLVPMITDRFC